MKLTFLGATRMVTGSSFLVETSTRKFLVDCGMFQGSKTITALNTKYFTFNPGEIDFVLLTHAHIDHSGLLPKLVKHGFKGPIYTTKVTAELCKIMLPDSAHIQEYDASLANKKGRRAGSSLIEPLYTMADAFTTLSKFNIVDYDNKIKLSSEVSVCFRDAGHILGSAIIEVWVTEQDKEVKLLFSGDLGQPNQPIIKDPSPIKDADYVIMETTYGNRHHLTYDKKEKLAQIINTASAQGGHIIIPAFAVGRTQTILYYLNELLKEHKIPELPIILDSPLATSATDIFVKNTEEYDMDALVLNLYNGNPLKMKNLKITKTAAESKAINDLDKPAIIISASGMADAGRILHHLKHNLWKKEVALIFVGYQAKGTLGRLLQEGAKKVKILGEDISVKAKIYSLDGFSAHADQQQLIDWLHNFEIKPKGLFLVHGEYDMSGPLEKILKGLSFTTYIPNFNDKLLLTDSNWQVSETPKGPDEHITEEIFKNLANIEDEYKKYRKYLEEVSLAQPDKLPLLLKQTNKLLDHFKKITS